MLNQVQGFSQYIQESLPAIEKLSQTGPIDDDIHIIEIKNALKKAKSGKATGPDQINNENTYFWRGNPTSGHTNSV